MPNGARKVLQDACGSTMDSVVVPISHIHCNKNTVCIGSVAHMQHVLGQTLVLSVKLFGSKCLFLIDTGATHSFISQAWVDTYGVKLAPAASSLSVTVADGRTI